MLGRNLLKHLNASSGYECTGIGFSRAVPPLRKVDLLNPNEISQLFDEIKPAIVVHCAAERFPDRASEDPKRTQALNVDSTLHLTKECARVGAVIVYISTDYVFDGGLKSGMEPPYSPDAKTMPANLYGESKLAGEEAVLSIPAARAVIVRVPVLYATDCYDVKESAALVIAKSLCSTSPTKVDNWGIRFPTLVDDVSNILRFVIDATQRPTNPLSNVRLHVSSSNRTTKYEMVKLMAKIMSVDSSHIEPNSNPPDSSAPRPRNTQLNCDETWKALEIAPYNFISLDEGLTRALAKFKNQINPSAAATTTNSS